MVLAWQSVTAVMAACFRGGNPRTLAPIMVQMAPVDELPVQTARLDELRSIYNSRKAAIAANKAQALRAQRNLKSLAKLRDTLSLGRGPKLEPDHIGVLELDGSLSR